jgi:F-type H+-transporting ATPase subunit a
MFLAASDPFHHVRDFKYFELLGGVKIPLPEFYITGYGDFQVTKFMVLQVIALLLAIFIFRGLAKRLKSAEVTTGRFWNFWESIAMFVRDAIVRPTIGDGHHGHDDHGHSTKSDGNSSAGHHADQYLPFLWSCFFFILFCNLLGAIPMMGSPTASLMVTGVLAIFVFGFNLLQGFKQFGFFGFWKNQCPSLGLAGPMAIGVGGGIWCIEVFGLFIKHGVLAIRLFANIMGGHTVVGVILSFIAVDAIVGTWLYALVVPASIGGQIFIGLLELFVSFLQAYVFTFLATIFLSASMHEH